MESITAFFTQRGLDLQNILIVCGLLIAATLLLSLVGRFVFGKRSMLSSAVSSSVGILFVYAATVVIVCFGGSFASFTAPLPLVSIKQDSLTLFSFANADYTLICSELLSLIILAFLMNLADNWLPTGKNLLNWLFFRILTVALGLIMHFIVTYLFTSYLPQGLVTYAPTVLLALLILMLLTGALKFIVGLLMATVNPIIAAAYTFFFANIVGKQITRAVLTTAIVAGLVYLLQYFGINAVSIAPDALIAYVPILLLLAALWYLVHKLF